MNQSCQSVKDYPIDNELFMGTYRVKDLTIPYPFFLQKNKSMYYLMNHNGIKIDSCQLSKSINVGDTLTMNNFEYEIIYKDTSKLNLYQLNDTIHFPFYDGQKIFKYRASFVPSVKTKKMSAQDINQHLKNNTYVVENAETDNPNEHLTIHKIITFRADSMVTRLDYFYENEIIYSEYQVQAFTIFNIGEKAFISCNENTNNPQPLKQILKYNKNQIIIRYFNDDKENIEILKIAENIIERPSLLYANCFDGHIGEYYHKDVTFKLGNEYLIKHIGKNAPSDTGDGYIIIHFNVNCHNQLGRPGVIMMDKNYKSKIFSKALVQHILQKVMKLKEWPSSVSDDNSALYPYEDVHNFLMVKIENGKITDLCP